MGGKSSFYFWKSAFKYYIGNNLVARVPSNRVRKRYYKRILGIKAGRATHIGMRVFVTGYHDKCKISIGNNCVINRDCYLDGRTGIFIGDNVNISFQSCILSLQHDHNDPKFAVKGGPVEIKKNAWLGARCIVLPGVTIGEGAVVAAGAVVTRDVEDYSVVGGVPAKPLGKRERNVNYRTKFSPYFDTDIFDENARTDGRSDRKQILVITLSPPLPANSGGEIYAINTICELADEFDFHLLTVTDESGKEKIQQNSDAYSRVFKSVHTMKRSKVLAEKTKLQRIQHLVLHSIFCLPFMDASYFSYGAVKRAREIVAKHNIELIEINTAHLAYFKKFLSVKSALLINHNIESDLFPFWLPADSRGLEKRVIKKFGRLSRRFAHGIEINNNLKFDAMTFISEADMARVDSSVDKSHIPLCFPIRKRAKQTDKPTIDCLWMGGFSWYPNAHGVQWFLDSVLPLLQPYLSNSNLRIHFLGGAPPDSLLRIHDGRNLIVHGFVSSVEPYLAMADLLFVPILLGAGVRVKILEAMSSGLPVVSTSKGCEGLGAIDGEHLLIADDPSLFASKLLELAANSDLRLRLADGAERLLREKFDLQRAVGKKRELYNRLLA